MIDTKELDQKKQRWQEVLNTVKKLAPEKLEVVKATLPVVAEHGEHITKRFYARLFDKYPEMRNIFNQTHQRTGHQPKALADAVYAAAANIEDLSTIMPALERIGEKHRSLQIKPEYYPIVGENLLAAIKDVLGSAATPEIIGAWADAYAVISDVFIRMENVLYQTSEGQQGGWAGYRDFVVKKKQPESDVITSFYLEPKDGKELAGFTPGQYITVKMDIAGEPYTHLRQYSLSDKPGVSHYRISVKREDPPEVSIPAGVVSTYLHGHAKEGDIIPVTAPAGDFYLDMKSSSPVVLLSGGVGLTPLMSMLNTIIERQPDRSVTFVQAAINGDVHGFRDYIAQTAAKHKNVTSYVVYQEPTEADRAANNFHKEGFVTLDWFKSVLPSNDAEFYFCGPTPFMRAVNHALKDWGVPEDKIHYEFFGAFGSLD